MSLAHFEQRFPASPEIRGIIQRIKEVKPAGSPVYTLCGELIDDTSIELRGLLEPFSERRTALQPGDLPRLPLTDDMRERICLDYAAIVFGTAGQAVEQTLIDGFYDDKWYCAVYNKAINGTMLPPLIPDPAHRQQVDLGKLLQQVSRDKTFSSFFESTAGFYALPGSLCRFIESIGIFPLIYEGIIPVYKPRAAYLTPSTNGSK